MLRGGGGGSRRAVVAASATPRGLGRPHRFPDAPGAREGGVGPAPCLSAGRIPTARVPREGGFPSGLSQGRGGGSHAPRPSGAGHRLAEKSPRFVSVSWETRVRRRVRGELHLGEVAASRLLQLGENIKSLSSASESPGKFCSKGGKTPSR